MPLPCPQQPLVLQCVGVLARDSWVAAVAKAAEACKGDLSQLGPAEAFVHVLMR